MSLTDFFRVQKILKILWPVSRLIRCRNSVATLRCADCQGNITEPTSTPIEKRRACSKCGSTRRMVQIKLSGIVPIKSRLSAKGKRPGQRKPFYELISGDDLFRLTGEWNKLVQIIDRSRDYYFKLVTNPKSGNVIRFCEEPLSKHQNRGSAKSNRGRQ